MELAYKLLPNIFVLVATLLGYKGGSHNDAALNAGTNGTSLMTLDGSGNLSVLGTISPAGSETNKDLVLKGKGTGQVKVNGELSVTSDLTLYKKIKVNDPDKRLHVVGDLVLGKDENNQKFIFHSRIDNSGDFLLITNDDKDGKWEWYKGITLKRGGNVGIGTQDPQAKLDVRGDVKVSGKIITGNLDIAGDTNRSNIEKHPTVVKSLYVTGKFGADCNGVEFRDFDGRQGIGFGYNTIYATGSDETQDLGLKAKGSGQVNVAGNASVSGSLSFGSTTRQMLNLWGTGHGIGVQNNTTYFRTSDNFAWYKGGSHNDAVLNAGTNGTSLMTLESSGNLVIGTTDTIKGKLHIEGSVKSNHSTGYRSFRKDLQPLDIALSSTIASAITSAMATGLAKPMTANLSVYASENIGCTEVNVFSDLRIKEIKGTSDSQADLQTLLQIQVTDYYYKDKIAKGNRPKKKVIGQQVADVYPQAVSTHVDTVPDIFESAIIEENWVTLNSHNLKIGDKVKIFWNDNDSQLFTVEDIKTDKFKIPLNHTGDIFVYGREVDDFHVVDYDALSMLHISATQELYKIIKKLEQKLNEKIKD
ncbi:MAG: hypothetical protein BEV12_23370 [Microcystis aeruginosa CACIAM 03]|nr:MAG: hypothetical protein BEV12_23370 [Microcystis aeruginosa CACIAM 03]